MRATPWPKLPARLASSSAAINELDLFRVFAVCFGQPSRESFAWLSGKHARTLWKQLGRNLGVEVKLTRADNFSDYSAFEATYIALFEVGVPEPPVPLLESAHSKRAVPQEIVLDCVNFYDVLGLRPSGSAFPADHLVTQLEFLAAVRYLHGSQIDSENADSLQHLERDFIERHLLIWLPAVQQKIDKLAPPLFPTLFHLLTALTRNEAERKSARDTSCREFVEF
jgi:DMSO reductase family type II enzyme chaperone